MGKTRQKGPWFGAGQMDGTRGASGPRAAPRTSTALRGRRRRPSAESGGGTKRRRDGAALPGCRVTGLLGEAPALPPEEEPPPRGRRGRAGEARGPQRPRKRVRGVPGNTRRESGRPARAQRCGDSTECRDNDSGRVYRPLSPARPPRRAIGSGAVRRGGAGGGPGMIHLECGSGWCTAQGTPVPDCGDVEGPACSTDRARSGPMGSRRPLSIPASCR